MLSHCCVIGVSVTSLRIFSKVVLDDNQQIISIDAANLYSFLMVASEALLVELITYAVTILISALFGGVLGRAMQVLGDKVRLLEVYVAFALMMVTAGFIHVWSDDELNTFNGIIYGVWGIVYDGILPVTLVALEDLVLLDFNGKRACCMVGLSVCIAVLNVAVPSRVYSLSLFSIEHQAQGAVTAVLESGQHGKIAG